MRVDKLECGFCIRARKVACSPLCCAPLSAPHSTHLSAPSLVLMSAAMTAHMG